MRAIKKNSSPAYPVCSALLRPFMISLMLMLTATAAHARCPAPEAIHYQRILPNDNNNTYTIEGGALLVAPGQETSQWVSDRYYRLSDQVIKLTRVEMASLESSKHGLTCIYSAPEVSPMVAFKMYEPGFGANTYYIQLEDEKEWTPFIKVNDVKYGYACNVATSTTQCGWDYVRIP